MKRRLWKYVFRLEQSFVRSLEYRAEYVGWIILSILPNAILLCIWQSVYGGQQSIQGYSFGQMSQYFILATLINGLTATHFETFQSQLIRQGKIDYLMTKPLSYPTEVLLSALGGKLLYICMILPLFLMLYGLFISFFAVEGLRMTLWTVAQFAFLMICGYLIEFCFALFSVFCAFWLEGAEGLEHFKWIIITLFSGLMIPINFMPLWMQNLVNILPFKYMYYIPISLLQQKYTLTLLDIVYLGSTLMVFYVILRFVWWAAVRRYASAGG